VLVRLNLAIGSYDGIYYHSLILEALKKQDSRRTAALMAEHLERSLDDLKP